MNTPELDKLRNRINGIPLGYKVIVGLLLLPFLLIFMPLFGIGVLGFAVFDAIFGPPDDSLYY